MPKKKITIAEALQALEQEGVKVTIERVIEPPVVTKASSKIKEVAHSKIVRLKLNCWHQINGVSYGPGLSCEVPRELASHLERQDQLAKKADADLLNPDPRFYLVTRKRSAHGSAYVGTEVNRDLFNSGIDVLGNSGFGIDIMKGE